MIDHESIQGVLLAQGINKRGDVREMTRDIMSLRQLMNS